MEFSRPNHISIGAEAACGKTRWLPHRNRELSKRDSCLEFRTELPFAEARGRMKADLETHPSPAPRASSSGTTAEIPRRKSRAGRRLRPGGMDKAGRSDSHPSSPDPAQADRDRTAGSQLHEDSRTQSQVLPASGGNPPQLRACASGRSARP